MPVLIRMSSRAPTKRASWYDPISTLPTVTTVRWPGAEWAVSWRRVGLAGGPGRLFDVALKLEYDLTEQWRIGAGYRTLEGGADTDDVYTFAWLHYGVLAGEMARRAAQRNEPCAPTSSSTSPMALAAPARKFRVLSMSCMALDAPAC